MPTPRKNDEREDVKRNRALIRKQMLLFIKNEKRAPTAAELAELTGLSEKTCKAHKKHIKLGDGSRNIYQDLTHDVMLAILQRAKGFTISSEKLLVVSSGAGMGSSVERHDQLVYHAPDMAAAKLWMQLVEGMSEKTDTNHSGEVKGGGTFVFNYLTPEAPAADGQ